MRFVIVMFCLVMPLLGYTQNQPSATDKVGAWYMFDANHQIGEKLYIKTGFQLRSFEVLDNLNLLFYHSGFLYKPTTKLTLTLGYIYLDIDRTYIISGENHLYENRPYEQLIYNHKPFNIPITHRVRVEHRFLNFNHEHTSQHRIRYLIGTRIKINETLFAYLNEEIFINFEDDVFRENRLSTGLGINISKSNHIRVGFLNHEINRQNLNRIQIGLFLKTDLRKKNKTNAK